MKKLAVLFVLFTSSLSFAQLSRPTVYLEPQQYTVSVWLVVTIADRTVIVFHFEAVQLKDKLVLRDQLLIFGAPMIAPAAQQTLIPSATCFHIGYGDERLRAHVN